MSKHDFMPVFCTRCMERAVGTILSVDGRIVEYCKCNRLWDRSNGTPVQTVVYYTDGDRWRLDSGQEKGKRLKSYD